MIPIETSGLSTALKSLDVKPEIIDKIVKILTTTSDELSGSEFETQADVAVTNFGNRPSAEALGTHYRKAQAVMQTTIDGIALDLMNFASGAKTAVGYIRSSDETSAADLATVQAAVEDINEVNANSQGDHNYDEGRNAPHGEPGGEGR